MSETSGVAPELEREIFRAYALGTGDERDLAREYGLEVAEIERILDAAAEELNDPKRLKRLRAAVTFGIALAGKRYLRRGMSKDGDRYDTEIAIKCFSALSSLLGLSAPQHHSVTLINRSPSDARTSTERIGAQIDRLLAEPDPEDEPPPSVQ